MVDVVVNHWGWSGDASTVDYGQLHPFNDKQYYHRPCGIDYNNQSSVEDCWIATDDIALPDLRTQDPHVRDVLTDWISALVANYSGKCHVSYLVSRRLFDGSDDNKADTSFLVDGLRIDTVKHVEMDFWQSFVAAAGVFSTGEVYEGDASYTCEYQEHMDSVLNFPM